VSFAGFSADSATEFAVEGFSEARAAEVELCGIRVLIVEPGSFRTGLFRAASGSEETATYADTVGATCHMIQTGAGNEPGNPAKAAAAILTARAVGQVPLRLPLGADVVDAIAGHLEGVYKETAVGERLPRSTDLAVLWPSYLGYVISFLVIGLIWANHHAMFVHIAAVDRVLMFANTLLLMCVAFIPFTAGVLASAFRSGAGQRTAVVLYGATLVAGGIPFNWIWAHAHRGHRLLSANITPAQARSIGRRFLAGPVLYLIGTILGAASRSQESSSSPC